MFARLRRHLSLTNSINHWIVYIGTSRKGISWWLYYFFYCLTICSHDRHCRLKSGKIQVTVQTCCGTTLSVVKNCANQTSNLLKKWWPVVDINCASVLEMWVLQVSNTFYIFIIEYLSEPESGGMVPLKMKILLFTLRQVVPSSLFEEYW